MANLPFRPITDLKTKDVAGKYVLVRADFNVPIKNGRVTSNFRLRQSVKTLKYLADKQAKVLVISHLGRGGVESLKVVAGELNKLIKINFASELFADRQIAELPAGQILLLENLRRYSEEDSNDRQFAKKLASLASIYINEAFSVSHRKSASIVGVPKLLPAFAGFNFINEYRELSKLFKVKKPFVVILGGAKFDTKLPVLNKLLPKADGVLVGGALAHSLWRKLGYEVGKSLVDEGVKGLTAILKDKKVLLPEQVVVKTLLGVKTKRPEEVRKSETIVDIGLESLADLKPLLNKAKIIFWNGPLGNCEAGFSRGTKEMAKMIAESKAYSIVGGGDTVLVIDDLGLNNKFDFVSTAGGAGLEFISKGTLVGITALEK